MNERLRLACAFLFSVATILALPWVTLGQETPPVDQAVVASSESLPTLTAAEVETSLATVEADTGIEEAQKTTLRTKYKQITEVLQQAEDFANKTTAYKSFLETASKRTAENREQLKALPSIEEAGQVDVEGSSAAVRKVLNARQAALQRLSDEFDRVAGDLLMTEGRPVEIGARLPQAERELSAIRNRWEAPELAQGATSPTKQAERFLLQAEYTRLVNEIEMMQQAV